MADLQATFFATAEDFRNWLESSHDQETELLVGYFKKHTGRPSMTWPESVDEALCFGWIDGVRRRIDDESYSIRFTPRKADSIWSAVNMERMAVLQEEGRVRPAGAAAYERRTEAKSKTYAYEQPEDLSLGEAYESRFRQQPEAWKFFSDQAPWYRKKTIWWVVSAKREQTRESRLAKLIAASVDGKRL